MSHPRFVVVGHPNKGKSSIVATLTLNDTIAISDTPGTTKHSRSFFLKKGDKVYYELIDTPGFQRPRKLLSWLKGFGDVGALERPKLIEKFLKTKCDSKEFKDECELLHPVMNSSATIYVVDASKPYNSEYENEMEILRYSAKPSLAILNYIGDEDYTDEWDVVLGQYFRIVKKFDPINADIKEHVELLKALSYVDIKNSKAIEEAIAILEEYKNQMIENVSLKIAQYIKEVLHFKIIKSLHPFNSNQESLEREFKSNIKKFEQRVFDDIKKELRFTNSYFSVQSSELEYDIFSEKSREIFGLDREKLILISTISGATIGGAIDLAALGHSFFLGSLIGAGVGFVGSIYGYEEISKIKYISHQKVQIGPIEDHSFGFVLLNRAVTYAKTLLHTTHANKKEITIKLKGEDVKLKTLRNLNRLHKLFKEGKDSEKDLIEYANMIKNLFTTI